MAKEVKYFKVVATAAPNPPDTKVGRQSKLPFRPSLFPHPVWMAVMAVLEVGADNYGVDSWRLISVTDHVEHARVHIDLWLAGDRTEPHLIHAICRLAFAAALTMDAGKTKLGEGGA